MKGTLWEGGHRVPAIAWAPGLIAEQAVDDTTLMTMDIYPTLLDFAGSQATSDLDGRSFKELLTGGDAPKPRSLFWQHKKQVAVRSGKWKLIQLEPDKAPQLFDLEADISESQDRAGEYPQVVARLKQELERWQQQVALL